MKALDTPVLLSILEGEAAARTLLRRVRGVEIATSEINLLELSLVSTFGGPKHRVARSKAIDRLRSRLTVLPIDQAGYREASARLSSRSGKTSPLAPLAALGAFEAYACDELFTTNPSEIPGKWKFKVTKYPLKASK